MTWLKGSTTWGNLVDKLTKLACGEDSDGASVTCAVGDRWSRQIAGQDMIRSPVSEDFSLPNMSNRAGYFAIAFFGSGAVNTTHTQSWAKTVCRQTSVWSGIPSTVSGTRWGLTIKVTTANSVANVYSTARITAILFDGDTGATLQTLTNQALGSSGSVTLTFTTLKTITIQLTDPSGFLNNGRFWRSFTSTYLGGIDFFGPLFCRRRSAPSFSVSLALPAVVGTDYEVVDLAGGFTLLNGSSINFDSSVFAMGIPNGGGFQGLGIKTVTALTGELYTCTWAICFHQIRLIALSGANDGQITLEWQGGLGNGGSGNYYLTGGHQIGQWLRPYQTPASVTSGSAIQYWMSVTPRKIVIVLNADPGQSGKLTCAAIGEYEPIDSVVDINPAFTTGPVLDYVTIDQTNKTYPIVQMSLYGWKLRRDGSEGRDWQTGYMRGVEFSESITGVDSFGEAWVGTNTPKNLQGYAHTGSTGTAQATILGLVGMDSAAPLYPPAPGTQTKPAFNDNKWWLYGFHLVESMALTGTQYPQEFYPRGYIDGPEVGIYWLPGVSWSSGDELTDTVTSKVYFLVSGDYHGIFFRSRYVANVYVGGIAILEE